MKGFKDFIMRGNLVELAVAFIVGAAFSTLVTAFTTMLMDIIGKIFTVPDFSSWNPGGVSVGAFITALVSFLLLALVIYFGIVLPFNKYTEYVKSRKANEEKTEAKPTSEELLADILAELKAQKQ